MDPDAAQKGIDNLRATAKWLLQTYAAVGALLLAGTPFTGIGRLPWADGRLYLALACALLALAMVAAIVFFASRVLVTEATTIAEVRRLPANSDAARLIGDAALLPAGATLAGLQTTDAYARAVLMLVAFERYRRRFVALQVVAAVGSIVAACAIALFVWAANRPQQQPIAYSLLDRADVRLTDTARVQLSPKLGAVCAASPVPVLILDDKSGFDVVSLPENGCRVARFTVKDDTVGTVTLASQ